MFDLTMFNSEEATSEAVKAGGAGFVTGLNENVILKEIIFYESKNGASMVNLAFENDGGKTVYSKLCVASRKTGVEKTTFMFGLFVALIKNVNVDVTKTEDIQLFNAPAKKVLNIPTTKIHITLVKRDYTSMQGQDKFEYIFKNSFRVDRKTFSEFTKGLEAKTILNSSKLEAIDDRTKTEQYNVNNNSNSDVPF